MPNWVFNNLTIEGSELDILRLKKQVGQKYTREFAQETADGKKYEVVTYSNPIFSFWNIIKPENMDAYLNEESTGVPDNPEDPDAWFKSNNWYDWNIRNWGTKWDVAVTDDEEYPETKILEDEKDIVIYKFDTAWAPPIPVIKKLSKQHPNLKFTLGFEEETSWGGEMDFTNGEVVREYDYAFRCECGEEWKEEPELDDEGQCPECIRQAAIKEGEARGKSN